MGRKGSYLVKVLVTGPGLPQGAGRQSASAGLGVAQPSGTGIAGILVFHEPHFSAIEPRPARFLHSEHMTHALVTGTLTLMIISVVPPPVAWSQAAPAPKARPAAPIPAQRSLPDKGVVEGAVYKNPSIGIEFTPPPSLHLQEPEMKGTPDAVPMLITVRAVADRGLLAGLFSGKSECVFYADKLSYYPQDKRDASNYIQQVISAQATNGFQHVGSLTTAQLSQASFLRADFEKGSAHEAVFVTTRDEFAFVLIFGASDGGTTDKLITSTKLRITN